MTTINCLATIQKVIPPLNRVSFEIPTAASPPPQSRDHILGDHQWLFAGPHSHVTTIYNVFAENQCLFAGLLFFTTTPHSKQRAHLMTMDSRNSHSHSFNSHHQKNVVKLDGSCGDLLYDLRNLQL